MPLTTEREVVATFAQSSASAALGSGANPGEFLCRLIDSVKTLTGGNASSALPVLLCPSPARYHVRRWLEPTLPKLIVMAAQEIPPDVRVRSMGTVG
jgi:flagellar biosynthesis protein FlhA